MNIQFNKEHLNSFQHTITKYKNLGFRNEMLNGGIKFSYIQPDVESYTHMRLMHGEGVKTEGFVVYVEMLKSDYLTNSVPIGVTNSEVYDTEGVYTGQKLWSDWSNILMESIDTLNVIINVGQNNKAPSTNDLNILEGQSYIIAFIGQEGLQKEYNTNPAWVIELDENDIPIPAVVNTASYYTTNWESVAFDYTHAKNIVEDWFNNLAGATVTDKFNSLNALEKRESIRWGVLPRNAEGNLLIENFSLNNNFSSSLRLWDSRRGIVNRTLRFETALSFLVNNITPLNKVDIVLLPDYKDFYIYFGKSTNTEHLIVNNELNPLFIANFSESDVSYSNMSLAGIMYTLKNILIGDRYISNFI